MSFDEAAAVDALYAGGRAGKLDPATTDAFAGYEDEHLAEGLRLQLAVLDRWLAGGEELGGWKVGLTSRAARDAMGVGFRPHGYLLKSRMFDSSAKVERSRITTASVEAEIGILLGAPLAGDAVTPEQARAAVAAVTPAFEINERRLPGGLTRPIRVADDLGQWGTVFGPGQATDDLDLAALTIELRHDGELVDSGTSGPDVIDDPYLSITRLCARLAENGLSLEAGQRLITGSLLAPAPVEGPGDWTASFGALGEVTIHFV